VSVVIEKVRSARDLSAFIDVPYRLFRSRGEWIPPLRMMQRNFLSPRHNRFLADSETVCYIATRNGQAQGRIMGIINHRLEEVETEKQARFCSFDTCDNEETALGLLAAVEEWAKDHELVKIVGPLGFSNQDPQGFIVEGFRERPSVNTVHNFEYMPRLMEKAGYSKEVDYVTYKIPLPDRAPDIYYKLAPRVLQRNKVRLLEFSRKAQVLPYLPKMLRFMNQTYRGIYGFVPLDEQEIRRSARRYAQIISPEFLKIVTDGGGEMVAFVIGIRDLSAGLQAAAGRVFPLGYLRLKAGQRKAKRLDLLLGAIKEDYRSRGLNVLMALAMLKSAQEAGIEYMDSHHELESNTLVQAEMRRMGGSIYKRHRVYGKQI
jgi:hypothetical protein